MIVLTPTAEHVRQCADALRAGQLVAMPTETVYGLAGAALDPAALARIFAAKDRPTFDPLIVHVAIDLARPRLEQLRSLVEVEQLGPVARDRIERLLQAFWPGPLTLVLPRTGLVPDLATSGLPNVAVRMPRHPVALALLRAAGMPLAAPSANRFGRISPTSAADVVAELGDRVGLVLDGGSCEVGVESTVLLVAPGGGLHLLRPGGIALAQLAAVAQAPVAMGQPTQGPVVAPGMLASHYAPRKPLIMLPVAAMRIDPSTWRALHLPPHRSVGLLAMAGPGPEAARHLAALAGVPVQALALSATGDAAEIARNLFRGLRELDAGEADLLLAEPCPAPHGDDAGLLHAIADRLARASADRTGTA